MERWRGHKALVTGASTGIGFAIVESLAKSGLTVIACARNIAKIEVRIFFSRKIKKIAFAARYHTTSLE
jgi:gluconate 5-dehydrogenase